MSKEIVVGIISGLLTSVIGWIIIVLFNKVIIPWIQDKLFNGFIIAGTWINNNTYTGQDGIEYKYEDKLIITQKGHSISGTYTCRNDRKGSVMLTEYLLRGTIQDGFVLINYSRKNKKGTGIGSFLLKIISNGDVLKGGVAFIELETTEVVNYGGVKFTKQNS